jgi:ferric-dicitrate binding protein FerR (iron transport regulator)
MIGECSRAWQAEAALDGRLSRLDTESFERHAAACEICAHEVRSLETLREVGQRLPILTSTPLEQRRLRQSVLRAANDLAIHPGRGRPKYPLAVGAVVAVAVVLLVFWLRAPGEREPALVAAAPSFQLHVSQGAAWTPLSRQATVRLRFDRGWFEVSVDKLRPGQRFIVELPEGELEVKGTRFIVEVHGKKTERVRVHEGRVVLRLRGEPPMLLETGDTWPMVPASRIPEASSQKAPSRPEPASATPPASPSSARSGASPRREAPPAAASPKPPAASPRPPAASPKPPAASPKPPAAGEEPPAVSSEPPAAPTDSAAPARDTFAKAMSAFSAGDFGKAETLFVEFERAHPADGRVEDATYLRAVALARRGDAAAARAIAGEYLRRYPNGFRRAEAERLLR